MVEESWLLEWYVMLENQSFMDQIHQSVSISKFLFYLIEFFNFSHNSNTFFILLYFDSPYVFLIFSVSQIWV